ncbi:MAG: dihydroxy-acid dehydratase [Candidatus Sigynarchaeota archaeon]
MSGNSSNIKKRSNQIFDITKQTLFYYVTHGIFNGLGLDEKEIMSKPLIGIASTWNEINPGHAHLNWLAEAVKYGIIESGGIPMLFNTIAPCDGYANGHDGMRFILPQRDIVADSIEAMVEAHKFDALVTLSTCDKINPGILMAAVRLDIPTICVPGGPNMYEVQLGPEKDYQGIETRFYENVEKKLKCITCSTYGACSVMGTANTTQCLMEAFGMTLPGAAAMPAVTSLKYRIAKESGRRIMGMLKEDLRPSKIMTRESLENALMVDVAIGGSTNSALHLPAIAHEMGIDFDLDWFNQFSKKIPTIVNVAPSGRYSIVDLYRAGGIPAVMNRLSKFLHLDCMTVTGKTVGKNIKKALVQDDKIIMPLDKPLYPEGGTVILKGSLAPRGAVIKQSAVSEQSMLVFEGPAIVFESEMAAINALAANEIKNNSVVVIRYEGPKGAPGMPELLAFTTGLMVMKELNRVALVSDGRFSGATQGPCIGHVCPEAYSGGPIALVQNGDTIRIDVPGKRLDLLVPEAELVNRRSQWRVPTTRINSKLLAKYRALVAPADRGCVLDPSSGSE